MSQLPPHSRHQRGRGTTSRPANRFMDVWVDPSLDAEHGGAEEPPLGEEEDERPSPRTQFLPDNTRSIITHNDSPDVGFTSSINPYRGCEHGCIYCYARPTHEYLGYNAGLDFETKIMVKHNAPELLRRELMSRKWKPRTIGLSGVTDCYQPAERELRLTRRCLEVLAEFRNPVGVVTKNYGVTRDIDVLQELAKYKAVAVFISVTTLNPRLTNIMEPRTSRPARRLQAIRELSQAGIPVGVLVAPVVPGLTDHEMPAIIEAATQAGARAAGYVMLRLPYGVKDLFEEWLETNMPEKKNKVLNRIRALRDGGLNNSEFGSRMRGEGIFADQVAQIFRLSCRRAGLPERHAPLSTAAFRRPTAQLGLFES